MQLEAERQKAARKEAEKLQKQQVMPAPHHIDCPLDASLPFAPPMGKGQKNEHEHAERKPERKREREGGGGVQMLALLGYA
jgi:hypothetical protein